METKQAALTYHKAGLSVIPIGEDKRPSRGGRNYSWKKHTEKLIDPETVFDDSVHGIGLVAGKVSGNVEVMDIDLKYDVSGSLFSELKDLISNTNPLLLKKMVVQRTVNGGYHFIYKCSDIEGNKKLASRYVTDEEKEINPKEKVKVLIETRGEGGFIACYPTKGYELLYGSIENINEISPAEREILMDCAKSFNEVYETYAEKKETQKVIQSHLSPFEDFNERGDTISLLEGEGWTVTRQNGSKTFLLRPGGTGNWSAEYHSELKLLYVWTSSSEFPNDKAYNPSQVLAYLKFNGDYSETAKWLLQNGYGESNKKEYKNEVPKIASSISLEDDDFSFVAKSDDIDEYLKQWREGTFQKGVTTGFPSMDKYFVLKRANFNIVNGKDNVGKSVFMWYILLLSALFYGWKWIIYSNENRAGTVVKRMIEFYFGTKIDQLTQDQFDEAKKFVEEHFTIISNDELYNYKDILNISEKLMTKQKYDGILIDPYNSLKIDLSSNSKLNTHEYHYEAASEMQVFTKKKDICIYLNCHVATMAARANVAPNKADTEGGSKFPNKADDFLTLHRYTNGENWRDLEVHVRKVKEIETGGGYTLEDEPYILRMTGGQCGYVDVDGFNPVEAYWASKNGFYKDEVDKRVPPIKSFYEVEREDEDCPF